MRVGDYDSRDYTPITFDPEGDLTNVPLDSEKRYIGIEVELEFDYENYTSEDDESVDFQEEIEVYSEDYGDYFYMPNPHYREMEFGPVNELVEDYYESGYTALKLKYDGSLENGIEAVLHPVEVSEFERALDTKPFRFVKELWQYRDEWDTAHRAGLHMHMTNLGGTSEQQKVEYIMYRIQYKLMDYTRDSSYASPFSIPEREVIQMLASGSTLSRGRGGYLVRANLKSNVSTHEFRIFNVPQGFDDDEFDYRIMQYVSMVKQVIEYATKYSLLQLICANIQVDEELDIVIDTSVRTDWLAHMRTLSSTELLAIAL